MLRRGSRSATARVPLDELSTRLARGRAYAAAIDFEVRCAAYRRWNTWASADDHRGDGVRRRARHAGETEFGRCVHVAERVSRLGRVERTGQPDGAAVRVRRADLRRPEERRDQGVSGPDR